MQLWQLFLPSPPHPCQLWTRLGDNTVTPIWLGVRDPAPQTVPSLGWTQNRPSCVQAVLGCQAAVRVNVIINQDILKTAPVDAQVETSWGASVNMARAGRTLGVDPGRGCEAAASQPPATLLSPLCSSPPAGIHTRARSLGLYGEKTG